MSQKVSSPVAPAKTAGQTSTLDRREGETKEGFGNRIGCRRQRDAACAHFAGAAACRRAEASPSGQRGRADRTQDDAAPAPRCECTDEILEKFNVDEEKRTSTCRQAANPSLPGPPQLGNRSRGSGDCAYNGPLSRKHPAAHAAEGESGGRECRPSSPQRLLPKAEGPTAPVWDGHNRPRARDAECGAVFCCCRPADGRAVRRRHRPRSRQAHCAPPPAGLPHLDTAAHIRGRIARARSGGTSGRLLRSGHRDRLRGCHPPPGRIAASAPPPKPGRPLGRLVIDARPINRRQRRPPPMGLPAMRDVIIRILSWEVPSTCDGKSFFY